MATVTEEAHGWEEDLLALLRGRDGRTQWQLRERVEMAELGIEMRSLAGRGFGLVATRSFAVGERILCEAPLIAWQSRPG